MVPMAPQGWRFADLKPLLLSLLGLYISVFLRLRMPSHGRSQRKEQWLNRDRRRTVLLSDIAGETGRDNIVQGVVALLGEWRNVVDR